MKRSVKKRKKRRLKRNLIFVLLGLLLLAVGGLVFVIHQNIEGNKTSPYYLAGGGNSVELTDKDGNPVTFTRGHLVNIKNKRVKVDEVEY
ncbi:MAG: hypothetical protein IKO38_07355, partial [Erysipelotrichaceae bacterium]|nr:hypothetical protein [Erysipelotrichaceae bacterium]